MKTKNDYFNNHLLPYLGKFLDREDLEYTGDLRAVWRAMERIKGVQTLIKQGDHTSIAKLYDLALCGDV